VRGEQSDLIVGDTDLTFDAGKTSAPREAFARYRRWKRSLSDKMGY